MAIEAYSDALTLIGDLPGSRLRADTLASLGAALRDSVSPQGATESTDADVLKRSAASYFEASKGYEHNPDALNQFAKSLSDRGGVLRRLAAMETSDEKSSLLEEATQLQVHALRALGRQGTYDLHSLIHWELANGKREQATLIGQSGDQESACKALTEARAQAEKALQYSNPEIPPGMQQAAQRLIKDIDRDRRALGCARLKSASQASTAVCSTCELGSWERPHKTPVSMVYQATCECGD